MRYTKEAMRMVRGMTDVQARNYLRCKQDSLVHHDKEIRDQGVGMKQFLDEKSYRPGLDAVDALVVLKPPAGALAARH